MLLELKKQLKTNTKNIKFWDIFILILIMQTKPMR